MAKKKDMNAMIEELEDCAEFQQNEVGEYWSALALVASNRDMGSDQFCKAVEAEVRSQIAYIKDAYEWAMEDVPIPTKRVQRRFLRERGN
jgi:hypothetical protein